MSGRLAFDSISDKNRETLKFKRDWELSKDSRVSALLEFGTRIQPRELFPVLQEGAASVIEENPFAFALAAVLDRGTKSEIIWTIPYYLQKKIGNLVPQFFVDRPVEELEVIFRRLPFRPRYITDAPRTVKELSQIVTREYDGDVTRIWKGKTSSYVKATFQRIYGVGPGIASMIVLLLEKCFKIHFTDIDHRTMDVKPDVHVVRVFQRLSFISAPSAAEALKAARKLNTEYPGELDGPVWIIGKKWCTPFVPQCSACPLDAVCPKNLSASDDMKSTYVSCTKSPRTMKNRGKCGTMKSTHPESADKQKTKIADYTEIKTIEQFEGIQSNGAGFIITTDTATPSKIHLPECRWISRKNFEEKVVVNRCKNGHYYWTDDIKVGAKYFNASPCGHCKPAKES